MVVLELVCQPNPEPPTKSRATNNTNFASEKHTHNPTLSNPREISTTMTDGQYTSVLKPACQPCLGT